MTPPDAPRETPTIERETRDAFEQRIEKLEELKEAAEARLSEIERERDGLLVWQTAAKQELTTKERTNSDLWARANAAERETARLREALLKVRDNIYADVDGVAVMSFMVLSDLREEIEAALSTATTPAEGA